MAKTTKEFLSGFLLERGFLYSNIPSQPLYFYKVTPKELSELEASLKEFKGHALSSIHGRSWAAGFCLYISEIFRREYGRLDGRADIGGWSWAPFEDRIGRRFTNSEHSELVYSGLVGFWKRSIRHNSDGSRAFLGSLFAEGGLPWQLVQDDGHGFGRAVRGGLKNYYNSRMSGVPLTEVLVRYEEYLPQQFKSFETRQLLAGIIEQLMFLVDRFELAELQDPAGHLDENHPAWAKDFPIPLDESNGRSLINDWLRDAGRRKREQVLQKSKYEFFSAKHKLIETDSGWGLRAEIILPNKSSFDLGETKISTSRLEACIYEDGILNTSLGYSYGDIQGNIVTIRLSKQLASFTRSNLRAALSLRLLENGIPVYIQPIENGAFEPEESPLIFTETSDDWWLAATDSCRLNCDFVKVRVPRGYLYEGDPEDTKILSEETDGAQWLEIKGSHRITIKGNSFKITLSEDCDVTALPRLSGNVALFSSLPSTVYLGWPVLTIPNSSSDEFSLCSHYVNGRQIQPHLLDSQYGEFTYTVKNSTGDILLRRRFGVLPKGFSFNSFPKSDTSPSRLVFRSADCLKIDIPTEGIVSHQKCSERDDQIELTSIKSGPPKFLQIKLYGKGNHQPVSIHSAFPYEGVHIFDSLGERLLRNNLLLTDLLGSRLVLSSSNTAIKRFILVLELMGAPRPTPKRIYPLRPSGNTIELSLYSMVPDIKQLMGSTQEQDALVRLSVISDRELIRVDIQRYNAELRREEDGKVTITSSAKGAVAVEAMLISDPNQKPISIPEIRSQEVGTGTFLLPDSLEQNGPWILYPPKESEIFFRPFFYKGKKFDLPDEGILSLHSATQLYDPKLNPLVIDEQIEKMALDLDHSGWQYLTEIKTNFPHLPLCCFLSWQSLANHPETLAIATFRMTLDEKFCTKIQDELAIVWDSIPISVWVTTYHRWLDWLATKGLPEAYLNDCSQAQRTLIGLLIPSIKKTEDSDCFDRYIQTNSPECLLKMSLEDLTQLFNYLYQLLRQNNESNDRWPTDLATELAKWINSTIYPKEIKECSKVGHMNSVTYLPIFMAHVSAGLVSTTVLSQNTAYLKYAIRAISEFDRTGWYQPVHAMFLCHLLSSKDL